MITINKHGSQSECGLPCKARLELWGNKDDEKPTEGIPNGSTYTEIDNHLETYCFDEEHKIWHLV